MKIEYEFNITITGKRETVDETFQNAIDSFNKNPRLAIKEEVIFTKKTNQENQIEA